MSFPKKPSYSKSDIDQAGKAACCSKPGSKAYDDSIKIINEWRVCHEYPMQTFNVSLRRKARVINKDAVVVRRLKRLATILDKIGYRQNAMLLSRMQDVGGVRAIMKTVAEVDKLRNIYLEPGRFPHILKREYDYIRHPKNSGYRGVHLVYEFNNSQGRQPDSRNWDGLLIEMQLRTELQHAWATSVEVVGTMRHENLKSSMGDKTWLELFQCMSSIIAQIENQPALPQHNGWNTRKLYRHTCSLVQKLNAIDVMRGWVTGMRWINERSRSYYTILTIDLDKKLVMVLGFSRRELDQANARLKKLEEVSKNNQPVLVAAGDIKSIKRAYPNYALDSSNFLKIMESVVKTVEDNV
ncbi:hypothetical protein CR983_01510 [Candidatus Saccharibacteria bacterium]|nr:MAG: hypothetical protein CR983_01510 [Candidatus Saccharibacteria bacterium]